MPKRALISVYNKSGIVDFAKSLVQNYKFQIISTGGTLSTLQKAGIPVTPVDQITNFPEMLDGRVKTLHPNVHAGLLAVRENKSHMSQLQEQGIEPFDMVVVNLYPFEQTVKSGAERQKVIEQIDIGGPSMLRSAAKNHESVAVVPGPQWYPVLLSDLKKHKGHVSENLRQQLAAETFWITSNYDANIVAYLSQGQKTLLPMEKVKQLRYGENPHQQGVLYKEPSTVENTTIATGQLLQGKEMSFLNYLDADAALKMVQEFSGPAVALVKHANPCGLATNVSLLEAFKFAHDTDPKSAFGVIIAMNRPFTKEIALEIEKRKMFVEVMVAPSFESTALVRLKKKPNVRLLLVENLKKEIHSSSDMKKISGGFLLQNIDDHTVGESELTCVTKVCPTKTQLKDLLFAFKAVKHVKSNAVVLAKNQSTVGIGAGQMSRVDSTEIAARKAGPRAKGSVLASDAFFPFPDSIEEAYQYGIAAIIQPGGSIRDAEVIAKANELGIPMVFTGIRAFRH